MTGHSKKLTVAELEAMLPQHPGWDNPKRRQIRDRIRYRTNECFRLKRINLARRAAGRPPIASLDETRLVV